VVPVRLLLPLPDRGRAPVPSHALEVPHSARWLALGLALYAIASTGVSVYLLWHLVEQGAPASTAASIAGAAGAAQVPGRLATGPLRRAIGGGSFLSWLLGLQALALIGVVLGGGLLSIASVLLFGAASGMMTLERAAVVVEWYGRETFGAHQGRLAASTSVARAISPFLVEAGHRFASYATVFAMLAVVLVAAAAACAVAGRVRRREITPSAASAIRT
jgi:hypothetical protein